MFNVPTAIKCDACLKPAPLGPPPPNQQQKKKPLVDGLPAGWEAAWDNAHGRMYYKNHVTKKTQVCIRELGRDVESEWSSDS